MACVSKVDLIEIDPNNSLFYFKMGKKFCLSQRKRKAIALPRVQLVLVIVNESHYCAPKTCLLQSVKSKHPDISVIQTPGIPKRSI